MPFMVPHLPLILFLLPSLIVSLPRPSSPPPPIYSDIDAHAVIEPFLRPFSHMYDMMQENHKAMSYAEKIEARRAESPLARSSGLFDLIEAEMKDVGLIPTTTTTTTQAPTTTPSILQKSLDLLFAPKRDEKGEASGPGLFASMLQMMSETAVKSFTGGSEQEEFRVKRRVKRQLGHPSSPFDLFDSMLGFNDPVALSNPFTPNPLMALFTTSKPLLSLPTAAPATPSPIGLPSLKIPSLGDSAFRIQDPFYNPLMPNRRNKVWEALEGMEKANKKLMKSMSLH
ncbi:osm-8 [Pristionchus pacificus]|uniref:Osm-8 n=1 Tax=Pristionchus pacificus TaxID=54126 RepID=A0A2A6BBL2_PRIPA|nr:osm-8 [Pristionchus pacificus]|eukprot:PDM63260.1 osm-8 [Pristionchus pacificus]